MSDKKRNMFQVSGFDKLTKQLKELPDKLKVRELKKIFRVVARDTKNAAKKEAPIAKESYSRKGVEVAPGNLKRSISIINSKYKNYAAVYVGMRAGKKAKYDGFYGQFIEEGTTKMKKNPFITRAFQQTENSTTKKTEKQVTQYLQKQINRLQSTK